MAERKSALLVFLGIALGVGITYALTRPAEAATPPGQFGFSIKITNWESITTGLGTAPAATWSAVYSNLMSTTGQTHLPVTQAEVFNGNPGASTKATIALVDASGNILGIFFTAVFTPVSGKVYTVNCWDGSVVSN